MLLVLALMDKAVKMRSSAQGGDNEEPSSGTCEKY